jgi:hypothetical protein
LDGAAALPLLGLCDTLAQDRFRDEKGTRCCHYGMPQGSRRHHLLRGMAWLKRGGKSYHRDKEKGGAAS